MLSEIHKIQIEVSSGKKTIESFGNLEVLDESKLDNKQKELHRLSVDTIDFTLGIMHLGGKFIYVKYNKN